MLLCAGEQATAKSYLLPAKGAPPPAASLHRASSFLGLETAIVRENSTLSLSFMGCFYSRLPAAQLATNEED
jgi:hypothetical protein